jgi:hypothetical protein
LPMPIRHRKKGVLTVSCSGVAVFGIRHVRRDSLQ